MASIFWMCAEYEKKKKKKKKGRREASYAKILQTKQERLNAQSSSGCDAKVHPRTCVIGVP